DDVALAAVRRAADDRPPHARVRGAPMNRQRSVGPFDRVRREPDVGSRWKLCCQVAISKNALYRLRTIDQSMREAGVALRIPAPGSCSRLPLAPELSVAVIPDRARRSTASGSSRMNGRIGLLLCTLLFALSAPIE